MSDSRPSASQRGYGHRWAKKRKRFLRSHPTCSLCLAPATVPDHYPESRKQLVVRGVSDPDADQYLRPLCKPCHDRETAKHQPGGFANQGRRKREAERHPGLK